MKKIMYLLIAVMFFSLLPGTNAIIMRDQMEMIYSEAPLNFTDVGVNHVNRTAIAFLVEEEVVQGYSDGSFKPNGNINRAELMKMIVAHMYEDPNDYELSYYKNCFSDIKDEWFAFYVCIGKESGWISGYGDNTFKPSNSVTRAEAMKIILNVMIEPNLWPEPTETEISLLMPADMKSDDWFAGFMRFAISKELLDGEHVVGTEEEFFYKPNDPITRKEVAEMIWRTNLYMIERIEYVEIISETACFQIENSDLTESEAKAKWVSELLEPFGYSEEEVDQLSYKYIEDDVLSLIKEDLITQSCGGGLDFDMGEKWSGFLRYAR